MFKGPEVQVQVKLHGNAKESTPYFRRADSTKEQMQDIAARQTRKAAITALTTQHSGELTEVHGVSCVPINRQQISNIRRNQCPKDKNVLYSVMLECKTAKGLHSRFVQDVKGGFITPRNTVF